MEKVKVEEKNECRQMTVIEIRVDKKDYLLFLH